MLPPYWNFKASIYIVDDVLFVDNRIIIPEAMKNKMLTLLHEEHFGMIKTRARENESMYWPGIKNDIEEMCSKCATCNRYKNKNRKEPLINQDMPMRAFQKVRVDLFEYRGKDYILCVDYYSKFTEIRKLNGKTAKSVQIMLLAIFAVHGVPEEVMSDNVLKQ